MPSLLETQRAFGAALRDDEQTSRAVALLVGDDALAARRIAVYLRNVLGAAAKALGAAFPVCRQIVGEDFFDGLARRYWRDTPSKGGDLHDYGEAFAAFLAGFEPCAELPYLPDLARLEWCIHRAHTAKQSLPLDRIAFASLALEERAQQRFALAFGAALLRSEFPIVTLWTIHQAGYEGAFAVDWSQSQRALVARQGLRVSVSELDGASYALYQALDEGATLEEALDAALTADGQVDLVQMIARAVQHGPLRPLEPHDADRGPLP